MSDSGHVKTMLRERATQWVIPPQPLITNAYDLGYIGGGNDISPSGYTGIKKIATTLSSASSNYDPSAFPATDDGLGWGWHYRLSRWVLMLNDSRSGIAHDIPVNSPVFLSQFPVIVTYSGPPSANLACYMIVLV